MEAFFAQVAEGFDKLGRDGRIDHVLFRNEIEFRLRKLDQEAKRDAEIDALLPFAAAIVGSGPCAARPRSKRQAWCPAKRLLRRGSA